MRMFGVPTNPALETRTNGFSRQRQVTFPLSASVSGYPAFDMIARSRPTVAPSVVTTHRILALASPHLFALVGRLPKAVVTL
jgi:hypothetical protein